MTKEDIEDLAKHLKLCANHELQRYIDVLNKFFDSNVCIPKGENRHPYADVFHEWAEDTTKQVQYYDCIWLNSNYLETSFALRIKPSEPVYEYLWYDADGDTKWMTLDEAKEFERPWFWAKETKKGA